MLAFIDFGSYEQEDKYSHSTTHSMHFLQLAFNNFSCLQVISMSRFIVINFVPSFYTYISFYYHSVLIFMAKQGRDQKMDCFKCCCITPFSSETLPWYVATCNCLKFSIILCLQKYCLYLSIELNIHFVAIPIHDQYHSRTKYKEIFN